MVGLARAIYNPRPGELAGTLRDPAELCNPALADRTAVESLLFDAFIPAAYRNDPDGRWKAQDAERWLVFLARHLERKIASPDLAWWQLRQAVPRTTFRLVVWLAGVLAAGVAGVLVAGAGIRHGGGLAAGLGAGLGAVLGFGLTVGFDKLGNTETPSRGMRISLITLVVEFLLALLVVGGLVGLAVGLAGGAVVGLVYGLAVGVRAGVRAGLAGGLGFAAGAGVAAGLANGLVDAFDAVPGDLAAAASPRAMLARDRRAALLLMLEFGLAGGLVFGLAGGLCVRARGRARGGARGRARGRALCERELDGMAVIHDYHGVAGVQPLAAAIAHGLPRRCPPARSLEASRRGLPVPAHRTTAPAREPRRG